MRNFYAVHRLYGTILTERQSTFHNNQWKLCSSFCNLKLVIIEMFSTQSNSRAEIFDTKLLKEPE